MENEKSSFSARMKNYWYHYKWHTVIAVFLAAVLAVCTVQMCTKDKYDCHILYAGPAVFGEQGQKSTVAALRDAMPGDYDGNGKLTPDFTAVTYVSPERAQEYVASGYNYDPAINKQSKDIFSAELMNGQCLIYFMDPALYADTLQYGASFFAPLSDVFDTVPDCAFDEYALLYRDTSFAKRHPELVIPSDTVVCLRVKSSVSGKATADWDAIYAYHAALFQNLCK